MDKQAIFDRVVRHILAQGGPSWQPSGVFYRAADGRLSPLGWLMGEAWSEPLEDRNPEDLPNEIFEACVGEDEAPDTVFSVALEQAHDQAARLAAGDTGRFWPAWQAAMEKVAREHGLSASVFDEIMG